jgi:hypothetical protein
MQEFKEHLANAAGWQRIYLGQEINVQLFESLSAINKMDVLCTAIQEATLENLMAEQLSSAPVLPYLLCLSQFVFSNGQFDALRQPMIKLMILSMQARNEWIYTLAKYSHLDEEIMKSIVRHVKMNSSDPKAV